MAGVAFTLLRPAPKAYAFDGVPIPKAGLVVNPAGERPGDPAEAERDFRRIYQALTAFRDAHRRLPTPLELIGDGKSPSQVGLTMADFQTPDYKESDGHSANRWNATQYELSYLSDRPDGTRKPDFPASGERDVWMTTDVYARRHQIVRPDARSEMRWTGCYVLLWSDGKIERVAPGDVLTYLDSPIAATWTYRGQTGNPKGVVSAREAAAKERFNRVTFAP